MKNRFVTECGIKGLSVLGMTLGLLGLNAQAVTVRSYHIGNSLTDQLQWGKFPQLVKGGGHDPVLGSQRIPGSPLSFNWSNPDGGFSGPVGGSYGNALSTLDWDALCLQAFQWGPGIESDAAERFYALALRKNPNTVAYVYQTWPLKEAEQKDKATFEKVWLGDTSWTNQSRAYFEHVLFTLRKRFPGKPVYMIPVGEVMYELDKKAKAGQVPGLSSVQQLYPDGIHLNDVGNYIVGCTHFAVLYKDDPVGLPWEMYNAVDDKNGNIKLTAAMAKVIQETARDVVKASAYSGVTSLGPYPVSGVTFDIPSLEIQKGSKAKVSWTILPLNAKDKQVQAGAGNISVMTAAVPGTYITVDTAILTGVEAGSTIFQIKTHESGIQKNLPVTVTASGTGVEALRFASDSLTVPRGSSQNLSLVFTPAQATNKNIFYRSTDTTVAQIDAQGRLTGRAKGRALIIAVSQNNAKRDTLHVRVSVPNRPPVPQTYVNPIITYPGQTVQYTGLGSSDPDSGDYVLGYDWDFGDGSPLSINMTPTHVYDKPGTYQARLRVLDLNETRSDWKTVTVHVLPQEPGLLAYEGFEYPQAPDTSLNKKAGGYGFGADWWYEPQSLPQSLDKASSLQYSNLRYRGGKLAFRSGSLGRFLMRGADSGGNFKTYATPFPNGWQDYRLGTPGKTLWASFLMQRQNAGDDSVFFVLHDAGFSFGYAWKKRFGMGFLGAGSKTGSDYFWSLIVDNTAHRGTQKVEFGKPALLVLKIEWRADNKTQLSLFVNPTSLGGQPPSTPAVTVTIDGIPPVRHALFTDQRYGRAGLADIFFDELRMGESYAAVTPTGQTNPVGLIARNDQGLHDGLRGLEGRNGLFCCWRKDALRMETRGGAARVEIRNLRGRVVRNLVLASGAVQDLALPRGGVYLVRMEEIGRAGSNRGPKESSSFFRIVAP